MVRPCLGIHPCRTLYSLDCDDGIINPSAQRGKLLLQPTVTVVQGFATFKLLVKLLIKLLDDVPE